MSEQTGRVPAPAGMLKLRAARMRGGICDVVVVRSGDAVSVLRVITGANGEVEVDHLRAGTVSRPESGKIGPRNPTS